MLQLNIFENIRKDIEKNVDVKKFINELSSFLNNISRTKNKYRRNLIIMCLFSFLIVNLSFASTMRVTYTFLGILGFIQILLIILANFRKNWYKYICKL